MAENRAVPVDFDGIGFTMIDPGNDGEDASTTTAKARSEGVVGVSTRISGAGAPKFGFWEPADKSRVMELMIRPLEERSGNGNSRGGPAKFDTGRKNKYGFKREAPACAWMDGSASLGQISAQLTPITSEGRGSRGVVGSKDAGAYQRYDKLVTGKSNSKTQAKATFRDVMGPSVTTQARDKTSLDVFEVQPKLKKDKVVDTNGGVRHQSGNSKKSPMTKDEFLMDSHTDDIYKSFTRNQQRSLGSSKHNSNKSNVDRNTPKIEDEFTADTHTDTSNLSKLSKYRFFHTTQGRVISLNENYIYAANSSSTGQDHQKTNFNQVTDGARRTKSVEDTHNNSNCTPTKVSGFSGRDSILARKARSLNLNKIGEAIQDVHRSEAKQTTERTSHTNFNISSQTLQGSERPKISEGATRLLKEYYDKNGIGDEKNKSISSQNVHGLRNTTASNDKHDEILHPGARFGSGQNVGGDKGPDISAEPLPISERAIVSNVPEAKNECGIAVDTHDHTDINIDSSYTRAKSPPLLENINIHDRANNDQENESTPFNDYGESTIGHFSVKSGSVKPTGMDNEVGRTTHTIPNFYSLDTTIYTSHASSSAAERRQLQPTVNSCLHQNQAHRAQPEGREDCPDLSDRIQKAINPAVHAWHWQDQFVNSNPPSNRPTAPLATIQDPVYDRFNAAISRPLTLTFRQQLDLQSKVVDLLESLYGRTSTNILIGLNASTVLRLISSLDPAWLTLTDGFERPLRVSDFPAAAWDQLVHRKRVPIREIVNLEQNTTIDLTPATAGLEEPELIPLQVCSGSQGLRQQLYRSRDRLWGAPSGMETFIAPIEGSTAPDFPGFCKFCPNPAASTLSASAAPFVPRVPPHGRGILIKNLPPDLTLAELFTHLGGGALERVDFQDGEARKVVGMYFVSWEAAGRYREFVNRNGGICWGGGVAPGRSIHIPRSFVEVIPGKKGGDEDIKENILKCIREEGATRCLMITGLPRWVTKQKLMALVRKQSNTIRPAIELCEVMDNPDAPGIDTNGQSPRMALLYMASVGTALGSKLTLGSRKGFGAAVYTFLPDPCESVELETLGKKWKDAEHRDSQLRFFESRASMIRMRAMSGQKRGSSHE